VTTPASPATARTGLPAATPDPASGSGTGAGRTAPWWRDAVVYQVYVRSFADGSGDGIGDLAGLRDRLDHLVDLGVDALWLNPCYPSPQADHGYDVSDYRDVDPVYGDLAAFDDLVARSHERGLRVLMDMVANHCSEQHPWFVEALAAGPGSAARERFHFRDGRGPGGAQPPNNWTSVFGGPAWTRVTESDGTPGQWYLHIFDPAQPDLNWHCPDVPDAFDDVLRFWFDRGVDGFRIDVAHGMHKHVDLLDWHGDGTATDYNAHMWNRPEVHEVYRRWRALADSYGPERDIVFVGEVSVPTVPDLARYLRPDELHQAFFFDLLLQPWDAAALRGTVDSAFAELASTGSSVTWTLANHDVHRAVTRYGLLETDDATTSTIMGPRDRGPVDVKLGDRRARAATMLLLALPGSVYLYQGEELGLPEVLDLPDELRQDPYFHRSGGVEMGRDGCRIPLPWTAGAPSLGFSTTGDADPWLPQPAEFEHYAVDVQRRNPASMLNLYRAALRLRRPVFPVADLQWLEVPGRPDVLAFRRGDSVCVLTCGWEPVRLPAQWGEVALASEPVHSRLLPGVAGAWLTGATLESTEG
jgi:alpha-glucosidase